jgi:acetyl esterase
VDPEFRPILELLAAGRAQRVLEAGALRAGMQAIAPFLLAGSTPLPREESLLVPGPGGPIPARLFQSGEGGSEPAALVVYAHGGGWVTMGSDTHARLTRELARRSGTLVVSLDYRLAPEHPFPAGLDDCVAAVRWLRDHAGALGAGGARLLMAGDSAGGNLTAATALRLLANGEPPPDAVALLCPVLDAALDTPSFHRLGPGDPVLDAGLMRYWRDCYVGPELWSDPFASPLRGSLDAFPPCCVVVAELDPLLDDGLRFAERLRAAGRPVRLERHPRVPHDFMLFPGVAAGERCLDEVAAFLREAARAR